eukprot:TRINITY_DN73722_c0_g1_i1.p1 TRINITY_DN73722_c0_g1~~TRINITY_DN73722_c0_g1_i1.p1  ORF type:complete len:440 (+),score=69.08 TRINITY_DN73722_c0_g1_i1:147-1466(+)
MHHAFYHVDPSLLPVAGCKTTVPPQVSQSLASRSEWVKNTQLERIDRDRRRLLQNGEKSIYGVRTPRVVVGEAAEAAAAVALGASAAVAVGGVFQPNSGWRSAPPTTRTPRTPPSSYETVREGNGTVRSGFGLPGMSPGSSIYSCERHDARIRGFTARRNPKGLDDMIGDVRQRLKRQGVRGFAQMEALFADIDSDRRGEVTIKQFQRVLLKLRLIDSEAAGSDLFTYFDEDCSGKLDCQEFLKAVRGQLSEQRQAVVHEAFATFDKDGDGAISYSDLKGKFSTFRHPQVQSGIVAEEDAFREFIEVFDTINSDGVVSLVEFERYYEYVSSLIADDAKFIACVRNAWHLPGATGGPCLKLRITRAISKGYNKSAYVHANDARDSRGFFSGVGQTVQELVEIRPDLDFDRHDPHFFDKLRRKLAAMGKTDVVKIEVVGKD